MNIILKNFRDINEKKYNFNSKFYLIKGDSGSGKSTIMEAIKFALFGGHKNIKPLKNTKKTEVELTYQDLKITRSKNPEQLKLIKEEKEYINQEAQYIINEKFNCEKIWFLSSYVPQDKRNIFIDSNSQEKIEIIKKIIFNKENDTNQKIFIVLDKLYKKINEQNNSIEGVINYIKTDLQKYKENYDNEIKFYNNNIDLSNIEIKDKDLKIYQKYSNINIDEIKNEFKKYPENLNLKILEEWKDFYNCKDEIKDYKICKYIGELKDLEEELFISKKNKILLKKYQNRDIKKLIANIKIKINYNGNNIKIKKLNKLEEYLKNLDNSYNILIDDWKILLENINYGYNDYDLYTANKIKENYLKDKKTILKCPDCNSSLYLEKNKLQKSTVNISKEEKENYINLIDNLNQVLNYKREAQNKIDIIKKDIKDIKDVKLDIQDENLETSLEELYHYNDTCRDIEIIEKDIKNYKIHQKYIKFKKYLNYQYIIPEPDFHEKYYNTYIYQKEILYVFKDVKKIKKDIDIDKLIKFKESKNKIKYIGDKEKDLKAEENKFTNNIKQLENIKCLINVIKEAENNFMEPKIKRINQHLNENLNYLFDEDINITISMFRKEKNIPQVNFKIFFKGIEYPNIDCFSGGQKNRISIALTLTFNIILGSPILMLDEVFSSLNEKKREECLNLFKKNIKDKILLNVCHETIEGFYDEIINL